MKNFSTFTLVLALVLAPGMSLAQSTGTSVDSVLPPDYQTEPQQLEGGAELASSSASTSASSSQKRAQTTLGDLQEIIDTEDTEHERISVNFGLRHRFDSSPRGLLESDISAQIVLNQQLLELYLGQEVLQERIRAVDVDEEGIDFQVSGRAELLGFISTSVWYDVSADLQPDDLNLSMSYPDHWYNFLISTENTGVREQQAKALLANRRFLSRLQLSAHIIDVSTQVLAGSDIDTGASSTPRG